MSSKWTAGDEDKDDPVISPRSPISLPSEQKDIDSRAPRRPRAGLVASSVDTSKRDGEGPSVKTITGGWGFEADGSTNFDAQSKTVVMMDTTKDRGIEGTTRRNHFDNDETEILLIPDLEDDGEDDMVSKVAAAPKNTTRRVPSLRELEEDVKNSIPSAAEGLDMSLLTKTLVPPEMLEEDDSPWDFDSLLQSVTQQFNEEKRSAFASAGPLDVAVIGSGVPQESPSFRMQGGSRSSRGLAT